VKGEDKCAWGGGRRVALNSFLRLGDRNNGSSSPREEISRQIESKKDQRGSREPKGKGKRNACEEGNGKKGKKQMQARTISKSSQVPTKKGLG